MENSSKGTVLIIDDSPSIVFMLKNILSEDGYSIIVANCGEEGIEKSIEYKPDVILLDVMMPGIDGFEVCRLIKSNEATVDIPILMVTAVNDVSSKVTGLKVGASDYLTKPFSAPELLARVASQMRIKKLHDELKSRNKELMDTYTNLKETQTQMLQMAKLSSLGEMIAGIAHELNNPLSGIIGYSELLLSREEIGNYHRQIKKIHGQAERCKNIIQNLLSFSREQSPEKTVCSIKVILEEVIGFVKYQLESDGIEIHKSFAQDLPDMLLDKNQLQQVFLNIINNSHQALKGLKREKIITINSFVKSRSVIVEITDTGTGIGEDILDKIFDPFFTTREVGEGRGLGLSICFGIIKEHGGNIKVDSVLDRGATFTVELPFEETSVSGEDDGLFSSNIIPGNILIVDDEEVIREVISTALEKIGHRVDSSKNGSLALEKIENKKYDLILTDIKMPAVDGKALYECIKEKHPHLSDKVLFMSGDIMGLPRDQFFSEQEGRIIKKPFSISQLQQKVTELLHRLP